MPTISGDVSYAKAGWALLFACGAIACFVATIILLTVEVEFISEKIMFLVMVGSLGVSCALGAWGTWRGDDPN
jgi:hypothetical protein